MISKAKLYTLVGQINEITEKFHSVHEYRGRYKLYIKNEKDVTGFMEPKYLFLWMTAYLKGLREGKTIMLDLLTKERFSQEQDK